MSTGAWPRPAREAIDAARAAVARLDGARHPEDNAADLIEGWDGAQSVLRVLLGNATLGGQGLIHEARTRHLLTLEQAHALVEFSAAAERAHDSAYLPDEKDLRAARTGLALLESAQQAGAGSTGGATRPSATPAPVAPEPTTAHPSPTRRNVWRWVVAAVLLVVVVGAGVFYAVQYRAGPAQMKRGVAAFRRGDLLTAERAFSAAARAQPDEALPHIYLARIAREANDPARAVNELSTAIRLEPENALALREMAAHQLAIGDLEMARRFYVRAIERDPADRNALGFLACVMAKLGRAEEAMRFHQRAGPGEWSACASQPVILPPPGMMRPPGQ